MFPVRVTFLFALPGIKTVKLFLGQFSSSLLLAHTYSQEWSQNRSFSPEEFFLSFDPVSDRFIFLRVSASPFNINSIEIAIILEFNC